MLGQDVPPRFRQGRGAGQHLGSPGLHHGTTEGLLLIADFHHEHPHVDAEHLTREGHGRTPLACPGLGGEPPDAHLVVVEGLRHCGVGFVGARRGHALVLVVDLRRSAQGLFQAQGPDQGGRPPQTVDFAHFLGDGDPPLCGHLLLQDGTRKDGEHLFRADHIAIRSQRGRGRVGQVSDHVVPVGRDLLLLKIEAGGLHDGSGQFRDGEG